MKIAFIIFDAQSAWLFHKNLFEMLEANEHAVHVIAKPDEYVKDLSLVISEFHPIYKLKRFLSPLSDLMYVKELYEIFRKNSFDIVHSLHGKPNVYGSIAALLAGVNLKYATIQGRGLPFSDHAPILIRVLLPVVKILYRISLSLSDKVWFLNSDDERDFIKWNLVKKNKAILIKSVGVDITKFSPKSVKKSEIIRIRNEWGVGSNVPVIGMITRLCWTKGVKLFLEAAKSISEAFFVVVGPCDKGPDGVPEEWIRSKTSSKIIWLNFRKDIRECIAAMDVIVLPSYYPEGVPRVLLEGLAMGKALITTDTPGCREVVSPGENGFLVSPNDYTALSTAMRILAQDDLKRNKFGKYSRTKCENEFSDLVISKKLVREFYN